MQFYTSPVCVMICLHGSSTALAMTCFVLEASTRQPKKESKCKAPPPLRFVGMKFTFALRCTQPYGGVCAAFSSNA